jgi:DNA-binding transcriptional ArsR family regulator
MPIDRYEPVDHIVLRTSEAISAYANPTRIAMLGILAEAEATLSMVALRLGTTPANLSHHIRKLLESRLIILIETRATSRNIEKYYRSSAYSYSIEPEGDKRPDEAALVVGRFKDELAAAASRRMRSEVAAGDEVVFASLAIARVQASDAASFRARLEELAKEFSAKGESAQGEGYTLGMAIFRAGA